MLSAKQAAKRIRQSIKSWGYDPAGKVEVFPEWGCDTVINIVVKGQYKEVEEIKLLELFDLIEKLRKDTDYRYLHSDWHHIRFWY